MAPVSVDDVIVLDEDGAPHELPSLWRERRILLVFLRHLGCRFCRQQVALLRSVQPELRRHGVEVVLVSIGTPPQLRAFKAESGFEGLAFVDPSPETPLVYASFQLRRGEGLVGGTEEGRAKGEEALAAGFVDGGYPTPEGVRDFTGDGKYTGDVFQVGGVFVLGAGNTCDFAYRSSFAGDHPDPAAILEAVTGVRADGSKYVYPSTSSWLDRLASSTRASTAAPRRRALLLLLLLPPLLLLLPAPPYLHAAAVLFPLLLLPFLLLPLPRLPLPSSPSPPLPAAASVPLLTPTDVDDIAIARRLVACDCSPVGSTDLATDWRVLPPQEEEAMLAEGEHLASLASLGALRSTSRSSSLSSLSPPLLTLLASPLLDDAALHQMRLTNCYLRDFLAKPHPSLGRAGPTCPFVPKSLQLGHIRLGVVPSPPCPSAEAMAALVRGFLPIFEALPPQGGATAVFKAIVLLFPHVPLVHAPQVIDGTQAALKEEFVSRGLMLGEFHLLNNSCGLHNANFFPLRMLCPALAIRHMVPSDLVFLSGAQYPPRRRAAFLQSYIAKMSDQKGAKAQAEVAHAQEMLDAVLAEIGQ
ncbi:hypothetical protein AB1Y20_018353 [Prymnesium parvum]|uniref:DUF6875 domain-containing protein n=1 Tax=Prymnesium parvum TaxID=97485 RepID=A0AB34JNI0_PRYPA